MNLIAVCPPGMYESVKYVKATHCTPAATIVSRYDLIPRAAYRVKSIEQMYDDVNGNRSAEIRCFFESKYTKIGEIRVKIEVLRQNLELLCFFDIP